MRRRCRRWIRRGCWRGPPCGRRLRDRTTGDDGTDLRGQAALATPGGTAALQVQRHQLRFRRLRGPYAIVRLATGTPVPEWAINGEFTSITRTSDELSIVCPIDNLPPGVQSPYRWTCLKLEGPFPFSQTGVLLSF